MSKRSTSTLKASAFIPVVYSVDPTECPFREFRDNELQIEFWGMGPAAFRAHSAIGKQSSAKFPQDQIWVDDQTQPLPRSVRQYLDGWIRAEELAESRWGAEVIIFEEESNGGKMSVAEMQLSHAQVLRRSSFCRDVLSACFILENIDNMLIEHQWENFNCTLGTEGWRAKYHIYSPGLKPGGGSQHRPTLSKNGCYLVRLYYLGAWRCVWVSDQVPIDATGAPLLPFSPLFSKTTAKPGMKQATTTATAQVVYLWPLLICKELISLHVTCGTKASVLVELIKSRRVCWHFLQNLPSEIKQALLKLAAPDMNSDEFNECLDDEKMTEFNVLHALTGAFNLDYEVIDIDSLWEMITSEVSMFTWDDDDDAQTSTVKSRSTKKLSGKDTIINKSRGSMMYVILKETKDVPPYFLPGITPSCEMSLLVSMARDLPLKKPLPEPEVAPWKHYRWVDWARKHGLYDAYDCPRTRFLKVNGLMKLSYAPHLLDVQSTDSITFGFIKAEISRTVAAQMRHRARDTKSTVVNPSLQIKEELREWIKYDSIYGLIKAVHILYYPSMFVTASAACNPPIRITKVPLIKSLDIQAPKSSPLYLQIDGPETITLKISLSMLHPRILANSGVLMADYMESAYMLLESFEWFNDCYLPKPKAFIKTCGYDTAEVKFKPGRHFCRIWVHARLNWHIMLMSESTMFLGPRDQIQCAAVKECPWVSKFLSALGSAFANWLRVNRSNHFLSSVQMADRDFFKYYSPDLPWDDEVVGYHRSFRHWMFRQALQAHLSKRLPLADMRNTYTVLRKYFCDPNFGLSQTQLSRVSLRRIADKDPCDCKISEAEETVAFEEQEKGLEEEVHAIEEIPIVSPEVMKQLLLEPKPPITSNICELATEELPCGILKVERNKIIRNHEAATIIQAHWRGMWARKCLNANVVITSEVTRALSDAIYGSQEALMALMNEFFKMYPGAKHAYSISSALSGVYGVRQYQGTSSVTVKCRWIPYFQGVFFCHAPVQVHFDVTSSLHHSTVAVYNNDTEKQLPQAFSAHKTFDFSPNMQGYTVIGHGSLKKVLGINTDVQWQLTVLSSTDDVFHICDNEVSCKETQLKTASKIHIDEIFLPNRRNILGGIQLSVMNYEAVSFRASATSPDLEMVATLRSITPAGFIEEISKCTGTGEIFWPYIRLEPSQSKVPLSSAAFSAPILNTGGSVRSVTKGIKNKTLSGRSQKSAIKQFQMHLTEPRHYSIEVTAASGWPLTINQWKRVDEVRNSQDFLKPEGNLKRPANVKEKSVTIKQGSVRDRPTDRQSPSIPTPKLHLGDAYVELECSLTVGGGIIARRDDQRDQELTAVVKSWDVNEPGRNQKGAEIRKQFREENLEVPLSPERIPSTLPDLTTFYESVDGECVEEDLKRQDQQLPGPTPATESALIEMSVDGEEEVKYFEMPEKLRDKFIPLQFVPLCTKESSEDECVLLSWAMAEAAKKDRQAHIKAALKQMQELQTFNEVHVIDRQRIRSELLDKLNVDARWSPNLQRALEERDEAIIHETLLRTHSANRKKQDVKSKK